MILLCIGWFVAGLIVFSAYLHNTVCKQNYISLGDILVAFLGMLLAPLTIWFFIFTWWESCDEIIIFDFRKDK